MKKNASLVIAFLSGIAITLFVSWSGNKTDTASQPTTAKEQQAGDSPVWSVRELKLKPGVSAETFEKAAAEAVKGKYGTFKDIDIAVAKADRGMNVGNYIFLISFKTKAMRDAYFPADGSASTNPQAQKFTEAMGKLTTDFTSMIDVVPANDSFADYVVI